MTIAVTGAAGFIGSHVVMRLLDRGEIVVGIDNHNDYYDPDLKEARVRRFADHPRYTHCRIDIADGAVIRSVVEAHMPKKIIHLAAQAGVRYSLQNPGAYIEANIHGFTNILEACRHCGVEHLVYASSSSVYGANRAMPFSIHHNVDHPLSLYAASKKANELMAHTYSSLFGLPTTGLRFFTVYGPWGRPDMALFGFTKAMLAGDPITLFNHGNHTRDFTYIDDIVEGVLRVLDRPAAPKEGWDAAAPDPGTSFAPWRVYNIGSGRPVPLLEYVSALERALGITAVKELLPLQPGDVPDTFADVTTLQEEFDYRPATPVDEGVARFVKWYQEYYGEPAE